MPKHGIRPATLSSTWPARSSHRSSSCSPSNTLRRRDNRPLREAVELAGRTRLRPILMTSLATMLGLVPMAIGIGEGGELQAPLAGVVIGGLLASTMVTLVLVPAVYTLFEEGWSGLLKGSAQHH